MSTISEFVQGASPEPTVAVSIMGVYPGYPGVAIPTRVDLLVNDTSATLNFLASTLTQQPSQVLPTAVFVNASVSDIKLVTPAPPPPMVSMPHSAVTWSLSGACNGRRWWCLHAARMLARDRAGQGRAASKPPCWHLLMSTHCQCVCQCRLSAAGQLEGGVDAWLTRCSALGKAHNLATRDKQAPDCG